MARRAAWLALIFAVVIAIALESSNQVIGQGYPSPVAPANGGGTPEAITAVEAQLPEGLELSLLASLELGSLQDDDLDFSVERIDLDVDDSFQRIASGDELYLVEKGEVSVELNGAKVSLGAGGEIGFQGGDEYTIEPSAASPTTLLRVALAAKGGLATPIAADQSAVATELLVRGGAGRLLSRRSTLFIARAVLSPGSTTGEQSLTGPIGLIVESGTIVVHDRTTPDYSIEAGQTLFVPGYSRFDAENEGAVDAVILVAGLLSPPSGAAVGPTATPTPTAPSSPTPNEAVIAAETALAEATRIAEQLEIQATREANAARTAIALETEVAEAESANAILAAELTAVSRSAATGATQAEEEISAAVTEIANLEATQEALSSAIAGAGEEQISLAATVTALAGQVESADASAVEISAAASAEAASLEATIAAQSASAAAAQATIEALIDSVRTANGTVEAQRGSLLLAEATIEAQESAISSAIAVAEGLSSDVQSASATIESQSGQAAAAEATIAAQESAIADGEQTASGLSAEVDAANATVEAQAAVAATAEAEHAASLAAAEATAEAYASALSAAEESAASAASAAAETAQADANTAAGLSGTIAALETERGESQSAQSTQAVEALSAEATIIALSTELASKADVAISSLNPEYVDLTIAVDLALVPAGDPAAIEVVKSELDRVLTPYEGCRAGVVLAFGHGVLIGEGTVLAAAVNAIAQEEYPDLFGGAAFDAFGDLSPELGQVDIRIYFFTGCAAAEG